MVDCEYWKGVIAKFSVPASVNWAAHVLASAEENLAEVRKCVSDNEIIRTVILAYSDEDWLTRSYCDEILLQFGREVVEEVYRQMTVQSDDVRSCVERLLTL